MTQEDDVERLRLMLGRQLATLRTVAQETQYSLAVQLPFSRSTVANVETGRQQATRKFWQLCDDLLGAQGDLLATYDRLAVAIERQDRIKLQQAQLTAGQRGLTGRDVLESPTEILARRATLNGSALTAELLADIEQLVVDVVDRYETEGPLTLAPETVQARRLVDQLLAGNQRLHQRARLFELAGKLSGSLVTCPSTSATSPLPGHTVPKPLSSRGLSGTTSCPLGYGALNASLPTTPAITGSL